MLQWLDEVVEQRKPRASNDSLAVIDETRSWRGFIKPENSTVKDDWHENVWNVEVRSSSLWWVREGLTGKSPTGQVCNIDGVSPNTAVAQLITNRAERGKIGNAYAEASALVKRRPDSAHAHFAQGYVLRYAGLLDESAHECDTALALDRGNYQFRSCSWVFMQLGEPQRAVEFVRLDSGSEWAARQTAFVLIRR